MNKSSVRSIIGCFGAAVLLTGTLTGCAGVSDVFYTLLTDQSETYSYEEQQFEEHEEGGTHLAMYAPPDCVHMFDESRF